MRSAGLEKQPAYLVLQHVFSRVIFKHDKKKSRCSGYLLGNISSRVAMEVKQR